MRQPVRIETERLVLRCYEPADHAALTEQFGIQGIPMMVLVGPDGTILASSPTLAAENLLELVALQ